MAHDVESSSINVPIAVIVLVLLYLRVPESRNAALGAHARLDGWGACLATLGLGGLVLGLIESSNLGFGSPLVLLSLAVGVVLAIFSSHLAGQLRSLQLPAGIEGAIMAQRNKLVGIEIPPALSPPTRAAVQGVASEAYVAAFRAIMLISAALAVCSSLSAVLLIEGRRPATKREALRAR